MLILLHHDVLVCLVERILFMDRELPYYSYSDYLKSKYGEKVYKLPVNLPVGCPNRITGRGCVFCSEAGTGFEALSARVPVWEQLTRIREHIEKRYHAHKFIAYFQNYTNTFLPPDKFRSYIDEAAEFPDLVEIAVSTRPDCISREYLDILKEAREKRGLQMTIELGLQTCNYRTLERMNRGHTLAEFIDAVLAVRDYGFEVCSHVILNLPGDELSDVVETAKILSSLRVHTVKVHSLYLAKNTPLCEDYEAGKLSLCSKEAYFQRAAVFLDYLYPGIAVERLFSRIPKEASVFCNWGCSWWKLLDELVDYMKKNGDYQGKKAGYLNGAALRNSGFTGR